MVCSTCKSWYDSKSHTCPPTWAVWNPDQAETVEDARTIYARDAEDAAVDWGERDDNDSAEYDIAKGTSAVVCVQRLGQNGPEGDIEKYRVSGEYNPDYWADRVEEEP